MRNNISSIFSRNGGKSASRKELSFGLRMKGCENNPLHKSRRGPLKLHVMGRKGGILTGTFWVCSFDKWLNVWFTLSTLNLLGIRRSSELKTSIS
ncbi:hypothetical protein CDAR_521811 [Caerostris darwini]|uniref:Ribosomal protein L2 n=1 Tax=Caerostris darwini TaxID=1538125 RepID=A0AAV4RWW6_9ARAC|nr:hypothetical protein CDAR_521811 [Caerostris darwini]